MSTRVVIHKYGNVDDTFATTVSDIVKTCSDYILQETMIIDLFICKDQNAVDAFEKKEARICKESIQGPK